MKKQYGAVQDEFGQWELCYWAGGPKTSLCAYGKGLERHKHATAKEAECCALALAIITPAYLPDKFEEPQPFDAPAVAEACSEVFGEACCEEIDADVTVTTSDPICDIEIDSEDGDVEANGD